MAQAIYKPPPRKCFDFTKHRQETMERVDESFNNAQTLNDQLRRIAEYEGVRARGMSNDQ